MHRFVALTIVAGAALAIGCIDMSAPKGAASISVLLLPSPSVVRGDTMRDSLGVAAPLGVNAFDGNNAKLTGITPLFFISDTSHAGHLKDGTVLIGDKLGSIQLIGQVGGLQTPPVSVTVTVAPIRLKQDTTRRNQLVDTLSGDSATSIGKAPLPVALLGIGDTAAVGFVVKYTLRHAPASKPGPPAVYIADGLGHIATADTTHETGALRQLFVNGVFLSDQTLVAGTTADSAIVDISATYKGVAVSGSPITLIVPIKVTFILK